MGRQRPLAPHTVKPRCRTREKNSIHGTTFGRCKQSKREGRGTERERERETERDRERQRETERDRERQRQRQRQTETERTRSIATATIQPAEEMTGFVPY